MSAFERKKGKVQMTDTGKINNCHKYEQHCIVFSRNSTYMDN